MRIQLASDLHLEFLARKWPGEPVLKPALGADALVLAGDISIGAGAVELFAKWPVPVLLLLGNHEYYTGEFPGVLGDVRRAAAGTSITVLERNVLVLGDVRFLGATLWTDYRFDGDNAQARRMRAAEFDLSDHKLISLEGGHSFRPWHALQDHCSSRAWLEEQLALPFAGKTVVITHHAPHAGSVHASYRSSNLNPAFASDLTPVVEQADVWLHGHVHNSFKYQVGKCRVVANPRGYPVNAATAAKADDLVFENGCFDPTCVVDTDDAVR